MSNQLTNKERELIEQKVKEIEKSGGIVPGFKTYKNIEEEVTTQYIRERNYLKFLNDKKPESQHAVDKLARYEAAARGDYGDHEREDKELRLNKKISLALSDSKVGFGDMKRIIADTTAEFEQEERFKKIFPS